MPDPVLLRRAAQAVARLCQFRRKGAACEDLKVDGAA